MKAFDKEAARLIGMEMERAVQEIAKKHDLTITRHGGNFDVAEMVLKFKVTPNDKTAQIEKEKKTFLSYANLYGFDTTDYGREYDFKGEKFRIVGFDLGRPKYSVIGERKDGTRAMFPEKQVVRQFHPERIEGDLIKTGNK